MGRIPKFQWAKVIVPPELQVGGTRSRRMRPAPWMLGWSECSA